MSTRNTWNVVWALLWFLVLVGVGEPAAAQGGDDTCPALVTEALITLEETCDGLNRNEACYGHNRVDVTFWETRDDLFFSTPADRASLLDLQTIATSPLDLDGGLWGVALLNVQADVPEALPGQAVTFLLLGDVALENAVSPDEAAVSVSPVLVTTSAAANLRSRPGTNANVLASVPAGSELQLVGVNTAGDWYQTDEAMWVFADLVAADDPDALTALPVTDVPRYSPMQAFYFTTGLDDPGCDEAPNALAVQSPNGVEVTLVINDLEVQIGSTVIFSMVQVESGGETLTAMVAVLLQGHLEATINGAHVRLDQPAEGEAETFPAFAVTLNDEGRVDEGSRVVEPPEDALGPAVQSACESLGRSGFGGEGLPACDAAPEPYIPPSGSSSPASATPIPAAGGTGSGATGGPVTSGSGPTGGGNQGGLSHFLINFCTGVLDGPDPILEGQTVRFATGCCGSATVEEQQAREAEAGPPWITLDGTPLSIYITGIFWSAEGWYTNDGRYEWVATPGTHTVSGGWGSQGDTCTFTVEPAASQSGGGGGEQTHQVTFTNTCYTPPIDIPVFLTEGPEDYSFTVPALGSTTMAIKEGTYHIRFLNGNGVDWWDYTLQVYSDQISEVCSAPR